MAFLGLDVTDGLGSSDDATFVSGFPFRHRT